MGCQCWCFIAKLSDFRSLCAKYFHWKRDCNFGLYHRDPASYSPLPHLSSKQCRKQPEVTGGMVKSFYSNHKVSLHFSPHHWEVIRSSCLRSAELALSGQRWRLARNQQAGRTKGLTWKLTELISFLIQFAARRQRLKRLWQRGFITATMDDQERGVFLLFLYQDSGAIKA